MFFSESDLSIELLGVFKINRDKYDHKSFENRGYDILSFRTQICAVPFPCNVTSSMWRGRGYYFAYHSKVYFASSYKGFQEAVCIFYEDSEFSILTYLI